MNHDLRIERLFDATPEEVFDAFVDQGQARHRTTRHPKGEGGDE
jgi:uncharacterized protein YndB with AHSA1/START domain